MSIWRPEKNKRPSPQAVDTLKRQIAEHVAGEMEWLAEDALGDSPIEKLFHLALESHCRFVGGALTVYVPTDATDRARVFAEQRPGTLIVEPQAQLEGWRVDFLIHAWDFGRLTGKAHYRSLIVECDGHDYHERTKDRAARDRGRDRAFQLRGFTILRFTGSEIHSDPLCCANQVREWVELGW